MTAAINSCSFTAAASAASASAGSSCQREGAPPRRGAARDMRARRHGARNFSTPYVARANFAMVFLKSLHHF